MGPPVLVAPIAEGGLEHVVARRRRIQPDDPVAAESALQHRGPETASGADVDNPTAGPLDETTDELDRFGARERPAEVLGRPVLDVGGNERVGVPGPVAAQPAIGHVTGMPQRGFDVLQKRDAAFFVSSRQAGKPANRPPVHRAAGSTNSLPRSRQSCGDMRQPVVSDMAMLGRVETIQARMRRLRASVHVHDATGNGRE